MTSNINFSNKTFIQKITEIITLKLKLTLKINQADEEIRTLDPLLGKEMLYH